jgi:ankyrin repeat protein
MSWHNEITMGATMSAADLFAAIDAGAADDVASILAGEPALRAAQDGDGVSATMHALYRGQAGIAVSIAAALPALDVFEAAALGRADRLGDLLAADPNLALARSPDGFTALHFPAFFGLGDAAGASRALIAAGADVNARSENALSVLPIHSAVAGDHDDVVAILIAAGADVNVRQRHGWTPLHGAAQNGSLVSVDRLLTAGADPSARNDEGTTAADLARAGGHEAILTRLG